MNRQPAYSDTLLEGQNLTVSYGKRKVLEVPSIKVAANKVLALIGPNGSGKTTLLLCLALLLQPASGNIYFKGQPVSQKNVGTDIRRRFAIAFQEPLLLNMSVWDNVVLGLKLRGLNSTEDLRRAEYWLERFGIAKLAKQQAHTLSGGEAQRANLARAFALQPEVLFLDEPFAAVDTPTRLALFGDMYNILQETRCTTVMVTHDRNEAQSLAQNIAVLVQGQIVQFGEPKAIFSAPVTEEIAKFVGMENIVEGVVSRNENGICQATVGGQTIEGLSNCLPGGRVNICIRPEDITLSTSRSASSARNSFPGQITEMIPTGPLVRVSLDCGFPLTALITGVSAEELQLQKGQTVYASFKATAIHLIALNTD
jgi:tungstate transport system ATP-binding protein